ncbi:MAG TPA: hypothetical protein VGJ54_19455 [Streptosporangiaceae bacterium]
MLEPRMLPVQPEVAIAPMVVATLTYDGRLSVADCRVCPARNVLRRECIVPDLVVVELTDLGMAVTDGDTPS